MSGSSPEVRTLDLAVYGIVNAGKSSLINALAGRSLRPTSPVGGTTTEVTAEDWRSILAEVGPYAVRLIDTPGLEEVGDTARAPLATAAARRADLILFVTAEDLTAAARSAIEDLRRWGKPLLVAVNKMDLLDPADSEAVLTTIRDRLADVIPAADVIPTAAAPIVRRRVEGSNGQPRVETVRGEPEIAALEARLLAALAESAPDLEALTDVSEDVERHVASRQIDRAARRERAERVADETSVALAVALAVNPVPLLDFLTGSSGLAILVRRVADVYGDPLSPERVRALALELLRGARVALWGSLLGVIGGGALKIVPGLGHAAGAITQGAAAGTFGHILGRALVQYFENGHDWGDGGLVAALDRIAASTDRRALTRGLVARLKARLGERS